MFCMYFFTVGESPVPFDMFSCQMLATKAVPAAKERIQALMELGYEKSDHVLIGHDGSQYKSYWVLNKK